MTKCCVITVDVLGVGCLIGCIPAVAQSAGLYFFAYSLYSIFGILVGFFKYWLIQCIVHLLFQVMAPKQPNTGLFVGLNKGHVVTKKELAPRPSDRKGVIFFPYKYSLAHHFAVKLPWPHAFKIFLCEVFKVVCRNNFVE